MIYNNKDLEDYEIIEMESIEYIGEVEQQCITLEDDYGLYITDSGIITHNSLFTVLSNLYISTLFALMYSPSKYFGVSAATNFTQVFGAASQKKSSELLFEPMLNILNDSDYFSWCRTMNDMNAANKEFENNGGNCIYWTKAAPSSVLALSNGVNYKLCSNNNDIIGQAQPLDSKIMLPDYSYTTMRDLKLGDKIMSPTIKEVEVIGIFPQGELDLYELEFEDGRTCKCSLNHLWKISYRIDEETNEPIWDIKNTEWILNNMSILEIDFFDKEF